MGEDNAGVVLKSVAQVEWALVLSGARPAAENMALDEALLENAGAFGKPLLRFYSWSEPAATFGYFQKYAEIETVTHLRPLVRRPTGGGLVPHDADWTYSLIFPPNDPWFALKAAQSYRRVHEWIQAAFYDLGIATKLSPISYHDVPGQCFIGAEESDLLFEGRKIAGAAQRRNRMGLLIQGSIQPPSGATREAWLESFKKTAGQWWKAGWVDWELTPGIAERTRELVVNKYSQPAYNRKK
jgi:lipoyl(octanoyl) transferase